MKSVLKLKKSIFLILWLIKYRKIESQEQFRVLTISLYFNFMLNYKKLAKLALQPEQQTTY